MSKSDNTFDQSIKSVNKKDESRKKETSSESLGFLPATVLILFVLSLVAIPIGIAAMFFGFAYRLIMGW